jgi:hypothetical protein
MSNFLHAERLMLVAGFFLLSTSAGAEPVPTSDAVDQWGTAQVVFVGKLVKVTPGPTARSLPPIYTNKLKFEIQQVLRGPLKAGASIDCAHRARQRNQPVFPQGEVCLVAAEQKRGTWIAGQVVRATPELIEQVRLVAALPLGWRVAGGKPLSPWWHLEEYRWPEGAALTGEHVCGKTGRPALLAGEDVRLEVKPVPPAKSIQWTNPDGDGLYTVTVTNTTDKELEIPSLLSDGEKPLWNESLVILCQDRAYPAPGAGALPKKLQPTRLAAGESVSTTVNAFLLDGPEWPRGGYRIEFQFCLSELSQVQSFYYLSKHHDAVRAEAVETAKTPEK